MAVSSQRSSGRRGTLSSTVGLAVIVAVWAVSGSGQTLSNKGLSQGRAEAARGDFYRALLTLRDVTQQLEARTDARTEVARAHAILAWAHLGMNQPEEAQAAVERALKSDPSIVVTSPDFPETVVSLFDRARRPEEDPEDAGRRALRGGRNQEALLEFQRALKSLPSTAPDADLERLRTEVIEAVTGMDPKPPVPLEALKHFDKARELEGAQALFGAATPASMTAVLNELGAAVRLAPWWPEALFALAQTQHALGKLDESLATLRLYKLADSTGRVAAERNRVPSPEPVAGTALPPTTSTSGAQSAVPALNTGTGSVVIYRLSKFVGSAARVKVDCNGVRMADLQNGRIVTFTAPAGKQTIKVQGSEEFVLDVGAGAEYFFQASLGMWGVKVRPASPEEAKAEFKEHNLKPNDAKRTQSSECQPASVQTRE